MAANWNESIYNENGVCYVLLWLVMRYRWAMRSMAVSTSSIIVAMQICQWITYRMVITVQIWLIINSPITRQRLGNILCKFYLELTYLLRNHFYALLIKKKRRGLLELNQSQGIDDLGVIKWDIALCLLVVYLICYFSLWKGISTSGKVWTN